MRITSCIERSSRFHELIYLTLNKEACCTFAPLSFVLLSNGGVENDH